MLGNLFWSPARIDPTSKNFGFKSVFHVATRVGQIHFYPNSRFASNANNIDRNGAHIA
jgi:hypothetical protein